MPGNSLATEPPQPCCTPGGSRTGHTWHDPVCSGAWAGQGWGSSCSLDKFPWQAGSILQAVFCSPLPKRHRLADTVSRLASKVVLTSCLKGGTSCYLLKKSRCNYGESLMKDKKEHRIEVSKQEPAVRMRLVLLAHLLSVLVHLVVDLLSSRVLWAITTVPAFQTFIFALCCIFWLVTFAVAKSFNFVTSLTIFGVSPKGPSSCS